MTELTKRIGTVREWGDSYALTMTDELAALKCASDSSVTIILTEDEQGARRIIIEPAPRPKK